MDLIAAPDALLPTTSPRSYFRKQTFGSRADGERDRGTLAKLAVLVWQRMLVW